MTAIISTTYDDKYFFFLPIVVRNLKLLGLTTVAAMPEPETELERNKLKLANTVQPSYTHPHYNLFFKAPEHKKATYAQVSRLFAVAATELPDDEIVFISDIDMLLFAPQEIYDSFNTYGFSIFGTDLVPEKQYPMCYITATAGLWRDALIQDRSMQECLDDLLGHIECENMRGNYFGTDQETAYNIISPLSGNSYRGRTANGGTTATRRIDRADGNWRSYLQSDTIDCHLWRDGFEPENFDRMMTVLQYFYPNENFAWITEYANAYRQLIGV